MATDPSLRFMEIQLQQFLCQMLSSEFNNVSGWELNPLMALFHAIKQEYAFLKPEVYKTILAVLFDYNPDHGAKHREKTLHYLTLLLSNRPDLADYLGRILPPAAVTLTDPILAHTSTSTKVSSASYASSDSHPEPENLSNRTLTGAKKVADGSEVLSISSDSTLPPGPVSGTDATGIRIWPSSRVAHNPMVVWPIPVKSLGHSGSIVDAAVTPMHSATVFASSSAQHHLPRIISRRVLVPTFIGGQQLYAQAEPSKAAVTHQSTVVNVGTYAALERAKHIASAHNVTVTPPRSTVISSATHTVVPTPSLPSGSAQSHLVSKTPSGVSVVEIIDHKSSKVRLSRFPSGNCPRFPTGFLLQARPSVHHVFQPRPIKPRPPVSASIAPTILQQVDALKTSKAAKSYVAKKLKLTDSESTEVNMVEESPLSSIQLMVENAGAGVCLIPDFQALVSDCVSLPGGEGAVPAKVISNKSSPQVDAGDKMAEAEQQISAENPVSLDQTVDHQTINGVTSGCEEERCAESAMSVPENLGLQRVADTRLHASPTMFEASDVCLLDDLQRLASTDSTDADIVSISPKKSDDMPLPTVPTGAKKRKMGHMSASFGTRIWQM